MKRLQRILAISVLFGSLYAFIEIMLIEGLYKQRIDVANIWDLYHTVMFLLFVFVFFSLQYVLHMKFTIRTFMLSLAFAMIALVVEDIAYMITMGYDIKTAGWEVEPIQGFFLGWFLGVPIWMLVYIIVAYLIIKYRRKIPG